MRVFFYFKYNSTDFLIFRLTVLEKRGAILHRNRKVLNSCFLKVQNLFFLEFYSIYPFPLTFLSVDFIVAALNSWRSMKCPPTHMGCQTVFSCEFHAGESFLTTAGLSGSSFLPVCQNQQIMLILVLSALWALHTPEQQPLLFGTPQQIVAICILWRKFASNVLQKWESED